MTPKGETRMSVQTERVQTVETDRHLTVTGVAYAEVPVRVGTPVKAGMTKPKTAAAAPTTPRRPRVTSQAERLAQTRATLYAMRRAQSGDARRAVQLTFLRLSSLKPGAINRALSENKVVQIAGTFNWQGFVALAVQDNGDGTYTVLDGHHRYAAIRRVWDGVEDDPYVPCVVQPARERAGVAETVLAINAQRTAWTSASLFWIRWETGDLLARALVTLLDRFGLRPVARDAGVSNPTQPGEVSGITTLEACAKRAGLDSAVRTVAPLRAAYGDSPDAYRTPLLRGVWDFVLRYADAPAFRGDVLVGALKATTPQGLMDRAVAKRDLGHSEQVAIASVIYDVYSLYLRGKTRLPRLPGFTIEGTPRAEVVALNERVKAYRQKHDDSGEAH